MSTRVRLTFDVSAELNDVLERLAEKSGGTKSELLRKAIALMEVAVDAKGRGQRMGVVDTDDRVVMKVVGV